jgi:poly-gamma-glutamate synthesis protein (capsule biosynthesis protein)
LWIDPLYPAAVAPPAQWVMAKQPGEATIQLKLGGERGDSVWIYALVAPFFEIGEGVTAAELTGLWRGEAAFPFGQHRLLIAPETANLFATLWGPPGDPVVVMPAENLLEEAWASRASWAIVPFDALTPRWKVLVVEGQSPVRPDFEPLSYSLRIPFSLRGETDSVNAFARSFGPGSDEFLYPAGNRDPDRLTTVAMSGVTALVRATAWTMEQAGITYPGQDIGNWLRDADLAHISNEVPFAENCPYPNPQQVGVVFCSSPRYIQLLEEIGTDVVELTGDHFHDWGAEAMIFTLSLYEERGWLTYGGGKDYESGRQPVLIEHNGNRLAFIGCNGKGGSFARASATTPGSVSCDFPWLEQQIADLTGQGILVIATFQHQEHYAYQVPAQMANDFRRLADAGAVIVSGSQAHHPHGFEFREDGFIHFGLGNLFFDQYSISTGTRQGFIDRHVIYDGRHISTELLPLVFVDFARARPMNEAERRQLLGSVFAASGW